MHRIDEPSATADNLFTEGSPTGGVPATVVSDDWLNDLQENVCRAIEQAGITLVKGDYSQLGAAISALATTSIGAQLGAGGTSQSDYVRVPFRDKTTGVIRYLTINMGVANAGGNASFTVTLPSAYGLRHIAALAIDGGASLRVVANTQQTLQNATFAFSGTANTFYFISVGI
jgi:hypothetical protein